MTADFSERSCVLHEDRLQKIEAGITDLARKIDALVDLEGPLGRVRDRVTTIEGSVRTAHRRLDGVEQRSQERGRELNNMAVKVAMIASTLSSGIVAAAMKLLG